MKTDMQAISLTENGLQLIKVPIPPDDPTWVGQRVVGELNIGCGTCNLCQRSLHKHCRQRQSLGIINRAGAFAEYLTLPIANLHPVPESVPDDQAIFCEPLAAAWQILEQIHIQPTTRVYVLGDGRLGLLVAQVLATTHCDLTILGRHPEKLAILQNQGISQTALVTPELDYENYPTADIVVEVTGAPSGFALARHLVRPGGTLVLKSTFANALDNFDISSLVVDEITVMGSRCGPFEPALRMLAKGNVAIKPLIHGRYPLADGVAALEFAAKRGVLKVLLST